MTTEKEIAEKIRQLVSEVADGSGEAILSTATADGEPHSVWMGTLATPDPDRLLTLTSPESRKVANIRANPKVEWMFTDAVKETVVYFRGTAEVVEDVEEIKRAWNAIPDKRRAFFLEFFNPGIGFTVIATKVESATYTRPRENLWMELSPAQLAGD